MKRSQLPFGLERKWLMPLIVSSVVSVAVLLVVTLGHAKSATISDYSTVRRKSMNLDPNYVNNEDPSDLPRLPRFAYLISGTKGDGQQLRRVLQAVYHPRNYYLLHLDVEASPAERLELAKFAKSDRVLREFNNVLVVGKANMVTYKGPTMIACTLHAIAILLKQAKEWDWFINLSASDYPLISQDGWFLPCYELCELPSQLKRSSLCSLHPQLFR
uniref:Beta-glucuronosyltransferase GlcAT14B-like n=1 Tax=Nelumbo nucifera TaxID=4432 RepID=A0A822XW51_NELNU|nr:TPA_asm: hypothetical protein HUJ06_027332 [Nelumbo nucifera]